MKILIWFRQRLDRLKEQRQLLEQKQEQRRRNAAVIAAQLIASAITGPGPDFISEHIEVNRLRNFGAVSPRLVYNLVADELRERTQSFDLKWFSGVNDSVMWFSARIIPSTGYKPLTEK